VFPNISKPVRITSSSYSSLAGAGAIVFPKGRKWEDNVNWNHLLRSSQINL